MEKSIRIEELAIDVLIPTSDDSGVALQPYFFDILLVMYPVYDAGQYSTQIPFDRVSLVSSLVDLLQSKTYSTEESVMMHVIELILSSDSRIDRVEVHLFTKQTLALAYSVGLHYKLSRREVVEQAGSYS